MTTLTTHILDTAHGCPAAGVRIDLSRMEHGGTRLLTTSISNSEGRTDRPLLAGGALSAGTYELQFHVGEYFLSRGVLAVQHEPPFLMWFRCGSESANPLCIVTCRCLWYALELSDLSGELSRRREP